MPDFIAVTMSADQILNRDVNFLNFEYTQFVQKLGYLPMLIPNDLDYRSALKNLPIKALLITGGHDIGLDYKTKNPELVGNTTPVRDEQELLLFDFALEQKMPVLGICRGFQLINVALGGDLVSDLVSIHPEQTNLHRKTIHDLKILSDDSIIKINSFHHQGLFADQLAPELEILAVSVEDQLIEAFKHKQLPILAVQWHPERSGGQFELVERLIRDHLQI